MNYRLGTAGRLTLLAIFLTWGVVGVLVRMTVPHFKAAFELGYRDALLVQSAFFITYLLFSRAGGAITARVGFRNGAMLGLLLMGIGAFGLAGATFAGEFVALLPSIFVLASGVTFLQVSANPLAAVEGHLRSASGNLTFAQGFNSLGTVAAPIIAGIAFLGTPDDALEPVRLLFIAVAIFLFALALLARMTLRENDAAQSPRPEEAGRAFGAVEAKRLRGGVAAIFLYVGAEVAITTTLVNLLEGARELALSRDAATALVSLYWLGMLLGRFAAVPLLLRFERQKVLAAVALSAALLCLVASTAGGVGAAAAILAVGLFGGPQFPTIFTISSADLEPQARAKAAGWLCTGIVGGGVVPLFYGEIADRFSLETALLVPATCFLLIALFALRYGAPLSSGRALPDRS
ncbi:MAG TPA: MFS transporter [Sphingopyxis sp.]|nr:MFS transporter [Sphingopyxis sp.]